MSTIPVEAKWNTGKTVTNETTGEEDIVYDNAIVDFDFGENIADAVAQFGEEPVFALYHASAKVQLQGAIRAQGEAGVPANEISSRLAAWKPGVRQGRVAVDPVVALKAQYAAADEAGQAELLRQIMGETEG